MSGLIKHEDVDAVLFPALLIIKDSAFGRLQVENENMTERFEAGDLVLIDPRVTHWVEYAVRLTDRKVVVFTGQEVVQGGADESR